MGPGANPGGGPMMQGPGAPGMAGGPGGYMGQQGYGEPNKGYINQGMYTRTSGGYPGGPGGYAGRWVFLFSLFYMQNYIWGQQAGRSVASHSDAQLNPEKAGSLGSSDVILLE